ncbi:extracellular solute-binding protein [Thermoanaerobacterium saccharolyticum]|uniref:ABC transporter substrate-binding protein n=1 Tax=Thermoanaerobacterium saccharolyticum TaxID=28896 RepID=UPI002FD9C8F4
MKMKKIVMTSIILIIIITMLAGCNSSKSNNASKESSKASDGQNITITMMYSGVAAENDFETQILPKLVKEKFPNITLEVTKLPDDQYYTALKTKLASGNAPDMFLVQPMYAGMNSVISLAKAGYLAPLNDLKSLKLVGESAQKAVSYNGNVYAMPTGIAILGTYYNKSIFDSLGLKVPTNWDEFLKTCETLKNAGIQPIVMGDKDMYVMQFGLYQIAANQIYPKNMDFDNQLRTGKTKFTDKGTWDKVLSMYSELYEKGYIEKNSLGIGATQAIQEFIDGKAAMIFEGSFNEPAIMAKGAKDFERGYFPLPGNDKGSELYASVSISAGPAIYAKSKYINECKQIIDWWYNGESSAYKGMVESGRFIPTYGYGVDKVNELFKPFIELYNKGKAIYWCNQAWPAGVENKMEELFGEHIGLGTPIDDITKGMQLKFEELNTSSN